MVGYLVLSVLVLGGMAAMMPDDESDVDLDEFAQEGSDDSDVLIGDQDPDILHGHDGDDSLYGDASVDILFGGAGDDHLDGGSGDDMLIATEGADDLEGGDGDDILITAGILDSDAMHASIVSDLENGQVPEFDAETINLDERTDSDDAPDTLNGGAGNDMFIVGAGDIVISGLGADTIIAGEWSKGADPVEVVDFNPNEDVLIYDYAEGQPEPDLSVVDDGQDALVLVDGTPGIVVRDGAGLVTLSDVILTSEAV